MQLASVWLGITISADEWRTSISTYHLMYWLAGMEMTHVSPSKRCTFRRPHDRETRRFVRKTKGKVRRESNGQNTTELILRSPMSMHGQGISLGWKTANPASEVVEALCRGGVHLVLFKIFIV